MIKFIEPTMEVVKFELCDVITTSTDDCLLHCGDHSCPSQLGFG